MLGHQLPPPNRPTTMELALSNSEFFNVLLLALGSHLPLALLIHVSVIVRWMTWCSVYFSIR